MRYFVVEIFEREISSITPCASKEEGIEIANRLLKKLIEEDYELDMHTLAEDGAVGDDYMEASAGEPCAWCNLRHTNWDAHVCEVPEFAGEKLNLKPCVCNVYALVNEQDTETAWGSNVELYTSHHEAHVAMAEHWKDGLNRWGIDISGQQTDEHCWVCGDNDASILDGTESERWHIDEHKIDVSRLLTTDTDKSSSAGGESTFNQSFAECISAEELAERALELRVGQTLYFKSMGEEVTGDLETDGVSCIGDKGLGMAALVFSAVGGGNSFMVDITEYDSQRTPREIADKIYQYYGNPVYI